MRCDKPKDCEFSAWSEWPGTQSLSRPGLFLTSLRCSALLLSFLHISSRRSQCPPFQSQSQRSRSRTIARNLLLSSHTVVSSRVHEFIGVMTWYIPHIPHIPHIPQTDIFVILCRLECGHGIRSSLQQRCSSLKMMASHVCKSKSCNTEGIC